MKVQSREAYGKHDLGFNARFLDLLHAFHRGFFCQEHLKGVGSHTTSAFAESCVAQFSGTMHSEKRKPLSLSCFKGTAIQYI